MLLRLSLLAATFLACRICAAEAPCGIESVSETVAPVYPPIARAAHVSGTVLLVATFDTAGQVTEARSVSGPMLLRGSAETFVKGWQANAYTGPRSCPVVVEFTLANPYVCGEQQVGPGANPVQGRTDTQHYTVLGGCVHVFAISDPRAKVLRRKHFGIFEREYASRLRQRSAARCGCVLRAPWAAR